MSKLQNAIGWRMSTALIWATVVVSGWYWIQAGMAAGLPARTEAASATALQDIFNPAALTRLLGATPPKEAGPGPVPSDRFVLSGIIASSTGQGVALISVDGKPARPIAVGTELAPGYVLVAVASREALLGESLNSPVRTVLVLPLQRPAEVSAALQGSAPNAPNTSSVVASPAASAPVAAEQITSVPARADARRQPQTTLQRPEKRAP